MMKITYTKLGRVVLIFLASVGATFSLNYANYKRYNSSIFTTQTVDFNILAHTLPTKLSYALIKGDLEELQKTLNSNYGLFGLVITDCTKTQSDCFGQKILFSTNSKYRNFKLNDLTNSPHDYLRDPIPLIAEGSYQAPFYRHRDITGKTNQGKILGRVYYIRGERPDFITSQVKWVQKPLYPRGVNILYTLTLAFFLTLGILIFCIIEWMILYYKNQKQIDLQKYEKELKDNEIKQLEVENKLLKLMTFNNAFEQVIDQEFTSEIANRLQQLDSIIKNILVRIDSDIKNIVHDIYKAPLLINVNSTSKIIEEFNHDLLESPVDQVLINYLKEADDTLKTLDWVVKDLRGTTRIESEPTLVQKEIEYLSKHLPPTLQNWIIDFSYDSSPLWINCNPWHLRSIVKNALYNSSAALKKYRRKLKDNSFKGHISVCCKSNQNMAIIEIKDNGPGIPPDILPTLYESSQRLNKTGGELSGNGSMIVFAYLSLHGGKVEKQNLEKGAKISFQFPLISEPSN